MTKDTIQEKVEEFEKRFVIELDQTLSDNKRIVKELGDKEYATGQDALDRMKSFLTQALTEAEQRCREQVRRETLEEVCDMFHKVDAEMYISYDALDAFKTNIEKLYGL